MQFIILLLIGAYGLASATNDLHTETIEYKQGDTVLEGFLAYDNSVSGKRPGVLVIHEWYGLNDYAKERAKQLAELGYVAFALDMYGKGKVAQNSQQASQFAGQLYKDRHLMRKRANAGLEILKSQEVTDNSRLAVIGFCFGGTAALELGMSGADLNGIVTFHGGLSFPDSSDFKNIKAAVLVLHGGSDPHVTQDAVVSFWNGMKKADINYQINVYGGAVHSFSNPASGNDPSRGVAYNKRAAERSWRAMQQFFEEIFGVANSGM